MAERAHPEDKTYQGTLYEHRMHERHRFAARYIEGRDVLDAGCGTGWGWLDLGSPRLVAGIDVSQEAIREGRRLGLLKSAAVAEIDLMPFRAGSFEAVICLDAIEHVPARAAVAFIDECRRVLRPGGILVLSTPLRKEDRHSTNPFHMVEYSEEEIRSLLDSGFECLSAHVDTEGDLLILLYAGRLKAQPEAKPAIQWSPVRLHDRAAAWLNKICTETGFRFTPGGGDTLISTWACFWPRGWAWRSLSGRPWR